MLTSIDFHDPILCFLISFNSDRENVSNDAQESVSPHFQTPWKSPKILRCISILLRSLFWEGWDVAWHLKKQLRRRLVHQCCIFNSVFENVVKHRLSRLIFYLKRQAVQAIHELTDETATIFLRLLAYLLLVLCLFCSCFWFIFSLK